MNKLILGDCFEVMKGMPAESVDLIYLDPPFFSNKNYEVIWGDEGEIRSFRDRWAGGIDHYIGWLKERVEEMHRLLKKTGSIYLHCDWHADAYIRVDILDKVFGIKNFINHIIWKRNEIWKKYSDKKYDVATDSIFWYSKSENYLYNVKNIKSKNDPSNSYKKIDETGRNYREVLITGHKSLGKTSKGMYEYKGYTPEYGWTVNKKKLIELDHQGLLIWRNGICKNYKKYLDEREERVNSEWSDIITARGKERIGYPTQKPEALVERIILASSNEGDVILDPFVGGGTTVAVADRLERKWIGIDESVNAIKVSEIRLDKQQDAYCEPFLVQLHKYDYDTLRHKDAFEFETWIINQFGGTAQNKKGGDKGIDGKMKDNTPIQVKRSDKIGRNVVDNFLSAIKRADKKVYEKNIKEKNPIGYIIAFSFSKDAVQEVARLKNKENIIIKLVEVKDIVSMADKPSLSFECNVIDQVGGNWEVEFIANSESPVEFYSWDFNYDEKLGFKADVIRDPDGKVSHKFGVGAYNIAVKVVDNEGLENIETKKLKVNGNIVIK